MSEKGLTVNLFLNWSHIHILVSGLRLFLTFKNIMNRPDDFLTELRYLIKKMSVLSTQSQCNSPDCFFFCHLKDPLLPSCGAKEKQHCPFQHTVHEQMLRSLLYLHSDIF